ncbi:MAG: hypothetical protein WCW16_04255 [Candidatus Magasanikbacteria bacterium]
MSKEKINIRDISKEIANAIGPHGDRSRVFHLLNERGIKDIKTREEICIFVGVTLDALREEIGEKKPILPRESHKPVSYRSAPNTELPVDLLTRGLKKLK